VKLFVWTDVLGGGLAIAVADTRDQAIAQVIETARTRLEADLAADRPKLRDLTNWTGLIRQDLKGIEAQLTRHQPVIHDVASRAAWYTYGSGS
jgi:hypothetical protein